MAYLGQPKKKTHLWKRATLIHILLFFVIGFFAGFTPTLTTSSFSTNSALPHHQVTNHHVKSVKSLHFQTMVDFAALSTPSTVEETESIPSGKQLVIITTTPTGDRFRDAFLTRMAHTLSLVPPPLLWIVVGAHSEASKAAELLRETGIMYRHLTFKENFSDPIAENDHQRNVALNHIEKHRLDGIVHFAGMFNTYDLQFFKEIRDIVVLGGGRWCSILWDPERHTRSSSQLPETTQDYIGFLQQVLLEVKTKTRPLQQVLLEVKTKTRPIPCDCALIMMEQLQSLQTREGDR